MMTLGIILTIVGCLVAFIGTIVGAVTLVHGFLRNFKNDVNLHIDAIKLDLKNVNDTLIIQNNRIDHLYQICVDLLRNKKEE